jgi:hypothetical protein
MLPIDLFEYKLRWRSECPYIIYVHSDLRRKAKKIIKDQFLKHKWHMSLYTASYQDSWLFEDFKDSNSFYEEFPSKFVSKKNLT